MAPPLTGLILAAGASSRMGRPKALLPIGTTTFVGRIAESMRLGFLTDIIVITAPALAAGVQTAVSRVAPPVPRVMVNPAPERGQLSSLLVGLDAAEASGAAGVVVCPVDVPLFAPATVAALVSASRRPDIVIARPAWEGRHGHPVLFMRRVFNDLRLARPEAGARAVVRAHATNVTDIEIDDPGAFVDVDTSADYHALVENSEGPSETPEK